MFLISLPKLDQHQFKILEGQSEEVVLSKVIQFQKESDLPPVVMSLGSTLYNKTGSWRYLRPIYEDKTAPCAEACPAGEDIQKYMSLVTDGQFDKAWETLVEENPFPAICGRVCYHPCELGCNRKEFDEPLAINAIERFIGDHGLEFSLDRFKIAEDRKERIAIVGSGPAGLTCAYHLRRLGFQVVVLESNEKAGGVLQFGIPEYRLPKDILNKEISRLGEFGIEIKTGVRVGQDLSWKGLLDYDAVFLATGVHKSRALRVPGENLEGVLSGLDFLSQVNRGQKVELGKRVAVIGGGNTAMDAVRSALRLESKSAIYYRRTRAEMPAILDEIEEAEREGIPMEFLVAPVEVLGKKGKVTGMILQKMELGEPDESGRRRPVPIPGSEFTVKVDNVIAAIGEQGDFKFIPEELVDHGVVKSDLFGQTPISKVFAGGDIIEQPHTVVHAIGSGKRAAMNIHAFLTHGNLKPLVSKFRVGHKGGHSFLRYRDGKEGDPVNNEIVVDFDQINTTYFSRIDRFEIPELAVGDRILTFDEVKATFDRQAVVDEANRCFHCGVCDMCDNCLIFCPDVAIKRREDQYRYEIDYDYCKGCGICAMECPRNAITLVAEAK